MKTPAYHTCNLCDHTTYYPAVEQRDAEPFPCDRCRAINDLNPEILSWVEDVVDKAISKHLRRYEHNTSGNYW